MKIGIDATPLAIPIPCGSRNYAENLIKNLAKIDLKNTYYLFSINKINIPNQKNFIFVQIPKVIPILKDQLIMPYLAKKAHLDVFHYLHPFGSVFYKHPAIVTTVLDVDLGKTYPLISRFFFNRITCVIERHFVFKYTKEFISISNTVRNELRNFIGHKYYNIIKNVYLGIDNNCVFSKKLNTSKKYFLAMADFASRKNIRTIINAYALLPNEIRRKHSLRIISSTLSSAKKFQQLSKDANITPNTKISVNVSKSRLVTYYNDALAFVYPSLYEGFGLPILEAMACGCPVITSNYGAMKEVSGGAAILVNPLSVKSLFEGMTKIATDIKLQNALREKGLKRASLFSWEKTARETLSVYKSLQ